MAMPTGRQTNKERSATTRAALIRHGRALFVAHGYAGTSTPQVAEAAGVSRGALYHQFEDKQALFRAVLEAESIAVADAIEADAAQAGEGLAGLIAGAKAYMRAMRTPGRTRLLLVEGPSVLGVAEMKALDEATSGRTLREGLEETRPSAAPDRMAIMTDLLAAAFDRAALAVEAGGDEVAYAEAIEDLMNAALEGL